MGSSASEAKAGRIDWVDVLKFFGMFAICVGHLGEPAGLAPPFVYRYHVHLFFFAAGLFALKHCEEGFGRFCLRKVRALYLPYLFFSLLSVAVFGPLLNASASTVASWCLGSLVACRADLLAPPLWFFPCLLVIAVAFEALRRLFRGRLAPVVAVAAVLNVAAFLYNDGLPRLPLTLDSAAEYLLYYAVGAWAFPWLRGLLGRVDSARRTLRGAVDRAEAPELRLARRTLRRFALATLALTLYAAALFFGKDVLFSWLNAARPLSGVGLAGCRMLEALGLIAFWVAMSKLCESVALFREMGRETLYLCGNEALTKAAAPVLLQALGLTLALSNPLVSWLYAFALMLLTVRLLAPAEKRLYGAMLAWGREAVLGRAAAGRP